MTKKKLVKRVVADIPQSIEEVSNCIAKVGRHQREFEQVQIKLNEDIEQIKTQALKNSRSHQEAVEELFEKIFIYAEKHRDELTERGKKKTVHFPTGEISWRLTPPSVLLKNVKEVLELCKKLNLERFIRVKEEVNKEAILKEPEVAQKIRGVTISQKEEFVVKPSETEIEIPRVTKKF